MGHGIESAFGQAAIIGFRFGAEGVELSHEDLIGGLSPLLEQWLGVIGMFVILSPFIGTRMGSDEGALVVEKNLVWIGPEGNVFV
jgi:hypothetical protein